MWNKMETTVEITEKYYKYKTFIARNQIIV